MQIVSFAELETPAALRQQAREIHQLTWPSDRDGASHDPMLNALSMLLIEDDEVRATLDVLFKPITHGGRRYQAAGLSMVATHPESRSRGNGHQLVTAAHKAMPALGVDIGIFTCDRELLPFYERANWQRIPGAVIVGGIPENPFPSDQPAFDKVTVGGFFTPKAQAYEATFRNSRIELYPGEIDKLW